MICKCCYCEDEFSTDAWRAWCSLDCQRLGAQSAFAKPPSPEGSIHSELLLQENKRLQLENAELKRKLHDLNTPDLVDACAKLVFGLIFYHPKWDDAGPKVNATWAKCVRAALRLARERWGLPPLKELEEP